MSSSLISRNPDLARLRAEGYDILAADGFVVMRDVPYVTAERRVERAALASALTIDLAGKTLRPDDHTILFTGSTPCDEHGRPLERIIADSGRRDGLPGGLTAQHRFSHKPSIGYYEDFYAKLSAYANILTAYARRIDPTATAATHAPLEITDEQSLFRYGDTATARAGIGAIASKLAGLKIAIVGLGGTGAYILDLVAKTAVAEIHLWDGDWFLWHNAFRAPGAPALDDVAEPITKVAYHTAVYNRFRRGVMPHPAYVDESSVSELRGMDFVFLALEDGIARKLIATELESLGIPFIDVGIGVYEVDGALGGVLRVTTSTPAQRQHIRAKHRLPFGDGEPNEYARNIQLAELNALNGTLAVLRWKRYYGVYHDLEFEHHTTYAIDGNALTNEDRGPCPTT